MPLFADCAEAALYGPHLNLGDDWVDLKLAGSTNLASIYDFYAMCDSEGWTTILARDADSPQKIVEHKKKNMLKQRE